ncbi:MAG: hypothetical protein EXR77_07985 [Myxococcales bacterium]|nr:hypothetical protein [Myxococcales bacterium]
MHSALAHVVAIAAFVAAGSAGCGSSDGAPASSGAVDSGAAGTISEAGNATAVSDGGATADSAVVDAAKVDTVKVDTVKVDTAKAPAPCKPWDAPADWTNCPADTHCGYDDMDAVACVANGKHGMGEDCSDNLGCKIGICVTSQNGSQNCSPFCTVDGQCDSNSCNKITGKNYKVCDVAKYVSCVPVGGKCPANQGCYSLGSAGFVCVGAGTKAKGEACKVSYDCAPGYTCVGDSGTSTSTGLCRKVCKTSGVSGCVDPTTPCSKIGEGFGYCEE